MVCLWSPYGWTFVEVSTVRCLFAYIGDNPVRVWIRNRTGENTQKVSFGCTPARGLNKVILKFAMVRGQQMPTPTKKSQQPIQMGTDDTKGYSGGSDIVLLWSFHRRSHRACYKFECLGLWEFVVKNNCKMSDCSSPVKRTLTSTHAHAFTWNTNPPYLSPSNVRHQKKRKKHWKFLNYEASIDQQFLTEIEHLIARLKVN